MLNISQKDSFDNFNGIQMILSIFNLLFDDFRTKPYFIPEGIAFLNDFHPFSTERKLKKKFAFDNCKY